MMITAELNHNPYLLETTVLFNGQTPKINSQIEKFNNRILKDWVDRVPQIFYEEMNGYDFDLRFVGTEADFIAVKKAFEKAGVSKDEVRLFHKNILEDVDTKSKEIDDLIKWLQNEDNRKFDSQYFFQEQSDLFETSYPIIVIGAEEAVYDDSEMVVETVASAVELRETYLLNTPIIVVITNDNLMTFRKDLKILLDHTEVQKNQLFFVIHPSLKVERIKREICDLGVEQPQIVSKTDFEIVLQYMRNYPVTEYVREAIIVFDKVVNAIDEKVSAEHQECQILNAEVHKEIDQYENNLASLKATALAFSEKDNFEMPGIFINVRNHLVDKIKRWKNRKTKFVGEENGSMAADAYETDLLDYMRDFFDEITKVYREMASQIYDVAENQYRTQSVELEYRPIGVRLPELGMVEMPSLAASLKEMKEITFTEPKQGLVALFGRSDNEEKKEPVRVVTYHLEQWRSLAVDTYTPVANRLIIDAAEKLADYYARLYETYHSQLQMVIAEETAKKEAAAEQLSDEERKLQEDIDWLQRFKDQLLRIERG